MAATDVARSCKKNQKIINYVRVYALQFQDLIFSNSILD